MLTRGVAVAAAVVWLAGVATAAEPGASHGRPGKGAAAPAVAAATVKKPGFQYTIGPIPAWVEPVPLPDPAAFDGAPMHFRVVDKQIQVGDRSDAVFSRVVRVVGQAAGLATASPIEIEFDPSCQALTLHRLDVVRQGQRSSRLQTARIELLQRETQLEQRVYDGRVTVSVVVDDLRVGDEIDFAHSVQGRNPVFGDRFVRREWLTPVRGPAQAMRLRVVAPVARAIHHRMHPAGVQYATRVFGSQREWVFGRTRVPQLRTEPGAPVLAWLDHEIEFSEFADWGAVASWGERLFDGAAPGPAVAALAAELRTAHPDTAARALAALRWVQREVRYLGIEIGAGTHRPNPPDRVLQQRLGDCKDKVALLVALLRAMDVPARPVLVSAGLRGGVDGLLPSPLAFDHVIARVDVEGRTLWLDPTRAHQSGPLAASQSIGFGRGLELARGVQALAGLPPPYDSERQRVEDRLRIAAFAEPVQLDSRLVFRNDYAEGVRRAIADEGVAAVADALSAPYSKIYPQLRRVGTAAAEAVEGDDAVAIVQRFEIPGFWRFHEQRALVGDIGRWAPAESLLPPKSDVRTQPLGIAWPGIYRHRVTVEFAEDVYAEAAAPRRHDEGDDHFRLTTRIEATRRQVDYDAELRIGVDLVAPAAWPGFLAATARALPQLGATLGVAPVAVDRFQPLQRELKALDEGLRAGRVRAVTPTQVESRVRQLLLTAAIDGGRLAPPLKAQALVDRGIARDNLGLYDAAQADFAAALAIDPGSAEALKAAAVNAQARGDTDRAVALATESLARRPGEAEVLKTRAVAQYLAGRLDAARADAEAALADRQALRSGYPLLWLALATRHAGADLAPLVERHPRSQWPTAWPRPLLDAVFDGTDAATVLRAARAEKQPVEAQAEAFFYLGERALAEGDAAGARANWQRTVDLGVVEFVEHQAAVQRLATNKR